MRTERDISRVSECPINSDYQKSVMNHATNMVRESILEVEGVAQILAEYKGTESGWFFKADDLQGMYQNLHHALGANGMTEGVLLRAKEIFDEKWLGGVTLDDIADCKEDPGLAATLIDIKGVVAGFYRDLDARSKISK